MPARNAEGHIQRAIESVLNQSCESIELLVADYGSADRTVDICKRFAERDIRIDVLPGERRERGAALDAALDAAHGRYLFVCGARDWIAPQMLEEALRYADRQELELAVCGISVDEIQGKAPTVHSTLVTLPTAAYLTQSSFRNKTHPFFRAGLFSGVGAKLFLRSRVSELGLRFEGHAGSERAFLYEYLRDVERVGMVEQPLYHHVIDDDRPVFDNMSLLRLFDRAEAEERVLLDLYRHWGMLDSDEGAATLQEQFLDALISRIAMLCRRECTLSPSEKRAKVGDMICSDVAQEIMACASPRDPISRYFAHTVLRKDVNLCYVEGCLLSIAKAPKLDGSCLAC